MTDNYAVHYTIQASRPEAHLYTVTCRISEPDPQGQRLTMPAWIPGSYMIRDFAKNIVQIKAHDQNGDVRLEKLDKQTWQCAPCSGALTLEYDVYAWDMSVRTAHLDTTHAYFNGSSVFLAVEGKTAQPCRAEILPPDGEQYGAWRVATTLPRDNTDLYQFGHYCANDYEELIDHPVEMGCFTLASFEAGGIPHDIVITGRHRADMDRLCRDLKQICQTHIDMFGELPQMERYMFLIMAVGAGYGGLEHRSSTSLLCSRNDLPLVNEQEISENYCTFLGLCSHEYFHTWNVKQIKPAAFLPYDLQQESYTQQLWAFEGITSYYDELALVRSGLITEERYLELLGQTATRVWRGSGRAKQSVAESSFDAWTKFYKQDENAPNAIVSYYTKGSLIALSLDLLLRRSTGQQQSLDDLMRYLWQHYGKKRVGVPEGKIEQLAADIAGTSLDEFFQHDVYGTEDPPLAESLQDYGIRFSLRPAENMDDKGGKPAKTDKPLANIGARLVNNTQGALISHVFDGGPAQLAGLSAGDSIIAIDQLKVDKQNIEKLINSYPPGSTIAVHAFRRDELMQFEVTLQASDLNTCIFELSTTASETQNSQRHVWLQAQAAPSQGESTPRRVSQ